MKKTILAVSLVAGLAAAPATAGSLADPILEEDLIIQETTSDGGILVPLIFLILALGPQIN